MKILITNAGFIGFHLAKYFLNYGYNVIGIDFLNSKIKRFRLTEIKF